MAKVEKVEVLGYPDVEVMNSGLCVRVKAWDEFGKQLVMNMYPEESKALRKALKRAEKRVGDDLF